jgi:hypothetical protein
VTFLRGPSSLDPATILSEIKKIREANGLWPNGRATNCQIAIGYLCGRKIPYEEILQKISKEFPSGLKLGSKPSHPIWR